MHREHGDGGSNPPTPLKGVDMVYNKYNTYVRKVEIMLSEYYGISLMDLPQEYIRESYKSGLSEADFVEKIADKLGLIDKRSLL